MASTEKKEEAQKTNKKWQKSYFDVLGICCSSEVPLVENILKSLDGVKEVSVIVPTRTVIVLHDSDVISPSQIAKALNQARLEANVRVDGKTNFKNKWPSPYAVVSGILLLLSLLKFVYSPLRWIAVAAVAAGIYPILAKAFVSIRRLKLDVNILIIITVSATLAMQDFTEAAAVVFLFTIADWLESRASYKATAVMQSVMSLAPQKAIIAETGEEVEVEQVELNTILAVKTGETIPIDGIVVDGNCEVDEKTLTGEAYPVPKLKDSIVWAGTINLNGYISVKTTALASDCVVAKMAKLVEEAQSSKTKSQRIIDKCSQYFTPAIIIISASIAAVPAIMKVKNLDHWFHLALVVLVSACPCGLILSTPVATFCALTKAATSGLLIKSADYLDTLSKIKIIAFDKTGTITRGEFIVTDFRSLSQDISQHNLLYWVSSVESKSSHPMAETIVDHAKSESVEPKPDEVEDYQNFPGEGIYGKIDGNDIYIGNKRIASRAGCTTVPETEIETKGGKTVGYIYVSARLAGVFNLSDACRSGVAQAIKELKDLGIKSAMLTGDNQESANEAQEQLGNALDSVHGDLLPEDKSRIIQEFKKELGTTAMVGDGVNDAPALAIADIGISMGISGSALATETGHVILMSNDIRRIPHAIKLARRTQRKVVQNVCISFTLKVGILALAIAGHPLVWAAVLADVGTCLIVIFNSMLLLRDKDKNKNKKCYRKGASVLNGEKLEVDLEAGLIGVDDQCNSGCCDDKKKPVVMKPSSGHSHSGCCEDKKKPEKSSHGHHHDMKAKAGSGCCEDKKPEKSSHGHHHDMKAKGGSGCCEDKKKPEKSSHDHHHDMKVKSGSSCCEDKKTEENVKLVKDGCCSDKSKKPEKSSHGHHHDMKVKAGSGCCSKKEEKHPVVEQVEIQMLDLKSGHGHHHDMKVNGASDCCGEKEEKIEIVAAKSCCEEKHQGEEHVEILDLEKGLETTKVSETCKASHCGDKESLSECCDGERQSCHEKTGEITLASEEETCHNLGGCCGDKEEVSEHCHEKSIHTESSSGEEIVKVTNQSCCNKSPCDMVLSDIQMKKIENCCKVKHHIPKKCCRSYVKAYCSNKHHHHHHHHHHNHVGAA